MPASKPNEALQPEWGNPADWATEENQFGEIVIYTGQYPNCEHLRVDAKTQLCAVCGQKPDTPERVEFPENEGT